MFVRLHLPQVRFLKGLTLRHFDEIVPRFLIPINKVGENEGIWLGAAKAEDGCAWLIQGLQHLLNLRSGDKAMNEAHPP